MSAAGAHVVVGLGANLGDAANTLRQAAQILIARAVYVAASSLYRSAPYEASGPDYVNAVLIVRTSQSPESWLETLSTVENQFGRTRHERNMPRTLDLDLLLYDDKQINTPQLCLPHPRMTQRRFVLEPLAEVAPHFVIPGYRQTVATMLEGVQEQIVTKLSERLL